MRFECQMGCIRCCEQKGFVYLTAEDIARIARYLKMGGTQFRHRYVCGQKPLLRFRKPRGKQCPFLTATGCAVHEVKPLQCRAFPYWPELLTDPKERQEAAEYCPGMGRGPLVNIDVAREVAAEVEKAFPLLYEGE